MHETLIATYINTARPTCSVKYGYIIFVQI